MTRPLSALWNRVSSVVNPFAKSRRRKPQQPASRERVRRAFLESLEERRVMAINVAVVGDISGGDQAGFIATRDQLNDDTYFDFNATLVNSSQVDTLAELSAYDVVIVGDNGWGGNDAFSNLTFTAALRSWIETQGGGVVMTGWGIYGAGASTPPANTDINAIIPVNTAGDYVGIGASVLTITNGTHPVTQGITSFSLGNNTEAPFTAPLADAGATILGTTSGQVTVVVGPAGNGRGVYLGPTYVGSSQYLSPDLRTGSGDRLLEQAVAWAAKPVVVETVYPFSAVGGTVFNGSGQSGLAGGRTNTYNFSSNPYAPYFDNGVSFYWVPSAASMGLSGASSANLKAFNNTNLSSVTATSATWVVTNVPFDTNGDGTPNTTIPFGRLRLSISGAAGNLLSGSAIPSGINGIGVALPVRGTFSANFIFEVSTDGTNYTPADTYYTNNSLGNGGSVKNFSATGYYDNAPTLNANQLTAGTAGNGSADAFVLQRVSTDLQVSVNGTPIFLLPETSVTEFTINGSTDNDTLTVAFAGGDPIPAGNVTFNGGTGGNDTLAVTGAPSGNAIFNYTNAFDGSVVVPGAGTINYTGLDPISYTTTGGTLTFNLTGSDDSVAVTQVGSNVVLSGNTIETTTVSLTGITAITINGNAGNDQVTLNSLLSQTLTLNVENVVNAYASPPTNLVLALSDSTVAEGGSTTLSGSFTDINLNDTYKLDLNWGDPLSPNNVQTFTLGATALTRASNGIDWNPTTHAFAVDHQYRDDNPSGTSGDNYTVNATVSEQAEFQITSLTANNAQTREHNSVTGDDRGGIALSSTHVFYNGDGGLGRFDRTNIASATTLSPNDGIVSNLRNQQLYTLAVDSATPYRRFVTSPTLTHLLELNSLGVATGNSIVLSQPITIDANSDLNGVFAGYDRILLKVAGGAIYQIDLPTGQVTNFGTVSIPLPAYPENWANWGVAERIGGQDYVAFASGANSIVRTNLTTGQTTTIATFTGGLSDMSSFTVDPAAGRWYFHFEGFTSTFGGSDETLGYADATINVSNGGSTSSSIGLTVNNVAPSLAIGLSSATIQENGSTTLTGTITDPGTLDTFTLNLNWGDPLSPANTQTFALGTSALTVADNGINWNPTTRVFSLPHQFLDDNPSGTASNTYTISTNLMDDDGGSLGDSLEGLGLVSSWVDYENQTGEMPSQIWGNSDVVHADRIGIKVKFANGLEGSATYRGVSGHWNSNFEGLPYDTATGFFTVAQGLHYLYNNTDSLPMAWVNFSMPFSDNFDLDYTSRFGSQFRASVAGWGSAEFKTYSSSAAVEPTTVTVTVDNVAPTVGLALSQSAIDENGSTTLTGTVTDPGTLDTFSLNLNWGDPLSLNPTQTFSLGTTALNLAENGINWNPATRVFSLPHQYLDDNPTETESDPYTISATVTDDDGGTSEPTSTTVTVKNVAPSLSLGLSSSVISENGSTTLTGTVVDVGTLDTFTLDLNWGDSLSPANTQSFALGTTALTLAENGINWNPATRVFSLPHQYLDDNPSVTSSDTYTIQATVTDDDGGVSVSGEGPAATPIATPLAGGYAAYETPYEDINLVSGAPGVFTIFDNDDDGSIDFNLGTNTFTGIGGSTSHLGVSTNGYFYNSTETDFFYSLSSDWVSYVDAGDSVLGKFEDLNHDSIADRLIIEWSDLHGFGGYGHTPQVTFQAILDLNTGDQPGNVIFNYRAIANDRTASATVAWYGNGSFLRIQPATSPYVADGKAILLSVASPTAVNVTVNNVNPVASAQTATTDEHTPITPSLLINVLAGLTDVGTLDTHTAVAVNGSSPLGALYSIAADGKFTYDPNGSFEYLAVGESTTETLSFTVLDDDGGSSTKTVTVTITGVNDAPTAIPDENSTTENAVVTTNAIANDTDPDTTDVLSLVAASVQVTSITRSNGAAPAITATGIVSVAGNSITFTPGTYFDTLVAGETATVVIAYTVTDDNEPGLTSNSTLTITVTGENDAPVATGNSYTIAEDNTLTVNATGVLGNDSDVDYGATLTAVLVGDVGHGSLTLNPNGSFSYTPAANYNGPDSFTYKANDGALDSNVVTVSLTVTPVDDFDFGDAPASYGVASHFEGAGFIGGTANSGPLLGSRDFELVSQHSAAANGDDLLDGDDENGVTFSSTTLVARLNTNITVNASAAGKLDAWIDFNRNGVFELSEKIATGLNVVAGNNSLVVTVPDGAVAGTTYARFRISSTGIALPTGAAINGEVEDYQLNILSTPAGNAQLIDDPTNPDGPKILLINGNENINDAIVVRQTTAPSATPPNPGAVTVYIAPRVSIGTFALNSFGSIIIFGRSGNDSISIESPISKPSTIYGDAGNDTILGGLGADLIYPGDGNDSVAGNAGNDVIYGSLGNDTLAGGADFDRFIELAGSVTLTQTSSKVGTSTDTYTGIEQVELNGTPSADIFTLTSVNLIVLLDAGAGSDTLAYTGEGNFVLSDALLTRTQGLTTYNLSLTTIESLRLNGGQANDSFDLTAWTKTLVLAGGGGTDTIIAGNDVNYALSDTLFIRGALPMIAHSTMENALLTGGESNNSFDISGWTKTATLSGGGGTDKLVIVDNVATTTLTNTLLTHTGRGNVTLASIEAADITDGAGNNTVTATTFTGELKVDGGAGNDTINGGAGPSLLLGGLGNDTIKSGPGRTVLIGGEGLDKLTGNTNGDLLISGKTVYDTNAAALALILAEWASAANYSDRVAHLTGAAGGLNGSSRLDGANVIHDNAVDVLLGAAGEDVFFAKQVAAVGVPKDTYTDKASGEQIF